MTRPARAWLAAALVSGLAGCLSEEFARRDVPVDTPDVSPETLALTARVEQVGNDLLIANPFLGVEPGFHVIGSLDPIILHPDANGVMVSVGLAKKCPTDDALAAVLASELGQMAAEKRTADRLKEPGSAGPPPDGRAIAAEVLRAAGYPEKELDAVAPLLADAARNRSRVPGFVKKPPAPKWSP